VSAIDVLQVVNKLNNEGPHVLTTPPDAPPPPFVDVNGDGSVTPNDPLVVINFLNSRSFASEGEATDLPAASGAIPDGIGQIVVMPMTSGRRSAESSTPARREGLESYFAAWEQAENSADPAPVRSMTWDDRETDQTLDGFLESLDDVYATSDDGLESLY
jgi:hypothetical protein